MYLDDGNVGVVENHIKVSMRSAVTLVVRDIGEECDEVAIYVCSTTRSYCAPSVVRDVAERVAAAVKAALEGVR